MSNPYTLETIKGRWSSAFFDTIGDETGETCLAKQNGEDEPVYMRITAPVETFFYVHQFTGALRCTTPLSPGGFGGMGTQALPNGLLLLECLPDGTERVMTNQLPIRCNMDFANYSVFTVLVNSNTLAWRFQITDDGTPFRLRPGHSLCWKIQDDMTSRNIACMHLRAGMITLPEAYK